MLLSKGKTKVGIKYSFWKHRQIEQKKFNCAHKPIRPKRFCPKRDNHFDIFDDYECWK